MKITATAGDGSWVGVNVNARMEDAGKTGTVVLLTAIVVNGQYEWIERAHTDVVVDYWGSFLGKVTIPTEYKDASRKWAVTVGGGNRLQIPG